MEHTINDSGGWAFVGDKGLGFRLGSQAFALSSTITLHFSSGVVVAGSCCLWPQCFFFSSLPKLG